MSASHRSSRRLASLVLDSGSPATIACDHFVRSSKICIVSSLSRRCSECLYRNRGCIRPVSLPNEGPPLDQEVALRIELDTYLRLALQCLARLDSLLNDNGSSGNS